MLVLTQIFWGACFQVLCLGVDGCFWWIGVVVIPPIYGGGWGGVWSLSTVGVFPDVNAYL